MPNILHRNHVTELRAVKKYLACNLKITQLNLITCLIFQKANLSCIFASNTDVKTWCSGSSILRDDK